jgi:hypothetical protein
MKGRGRLHHIAFGGGRQRTDVAKRFVDRGIVLISGGTVARDRHVSDTISLRLESFT